MIHSLSLAPKKDAVPVPFCDSYMSHEGTRKKWTIMWIHLILSTLKLRNIKSVY
jgi:hypothetical protein